MYSLSVIIPVYNTEQYIERCIESLINQTLNDIEIIIIDDGSTDKSLEIINSFKEKYSHMRVITQSNSGQGSARNAGINIAKGKYITFVDSDDWLEDRCLEELYSIAVNSEADIVICNMKKVYDNYCRYDEMPPFTKERLTRHEGIEEILKDKEIKSYPCAKLFRRELFVKNNILFPENMYYEDLAIGIQLFYFSNKVVLDNYYGYYYLQRDDSSTRRISCRNVTDRLKALYMIKNFLSEKKIFIKYKKEFTRLCIFHMNLIINQIEDWKLDICYEEIVDEVSRLIESNLTYKIINDSRLSRKNKIKIKLLIYNRKIYMNLIKKRRKYED